MNIDHRHCNLQNWCVREYRKTFQNDIKYFQIEYFYNDFGNRGFIDIYLETENIIKIVEVKPNLENLGEALRQAIQGLKYIQKTKKFRHISTIAIENNIENFKILYKNWDMLKTLPYEIAFEIIDIESNNHVFLYPSLMNFPLEISEELAKL